MALAAVALGIACNPYRDVLPPARCRDGADCGTGEVCTEGLCRRPGVVHGAVRGTPAGPITVAAFLAAAVERGNVTPETPPLALVLAGASFVSAPAPELLSYRIENLPLGSLTVVAVEHAGPPHEPHGWPCAGESYGLDRIWVGAGLRARHGLDLRIGPKGTHPCP